MDVAILRASILTADGGFDEEEEEEEPEDIVQAWDDLRYIQEEEHRYGNVRSRIGQQHLQAATFLYTLHILQCFADSERRFSYANMTIEA